MDMIRRIRWFLADLPYMARQRFWRLVPHRHDLYNGPNSDLEWCGRCGRSFPGEPAPAPPRLCAYCNGPLPEDAQAGQKYCKPGHKVRDRRRRNGTPVRDQRKIEAAWSLDSTKARHAASCERKTANGGAYESLGDALAALRWLRDCDGTTVDSRAAYRCLNCGKFHITSHADAR